MKLTKKDIFEIIDSNGELIGKNDVPTTGSDLESQASNTTDFNQSIGHQPMRYDFMARMGMSPMFYEGKEDQTENGLVNDLTKLMYEKYMETLKYYYRNPNKLKPDFRLMSEKSFETQPEERKKIDSKWADKIMDVIEKQYKASEKKNIDEGSVVEDKMVDKKSEDEMSKKSNDNDVQDKRLEKIAGLINKLDQKDINKLKDLLETK